MVMAKNTSPRMTHRKCVIGPAGPAGTPPPPYSSGSGATATGGMTAAGAAAADDSGGGGGGAPFELGSVGIGGKLTVAERVPQGGAGELGAGNLLATPVSERED